MLYSRIMNAEVTPLARRLVTAQVNGVPFTMHVDFGATASQLRTRSWAKAKLTAVDAPLILVDEPAISAR